MVFTHPEFSGGITTLTVRNSKHLCSNGHLDRSRWVVTWWIVFFYTVEFVQSIILHPTIWLSVHPPVIGTLWNNNCWVLINISCGKKCWNPTPKRWNCTLLSLTLTLPGPSAGVSGSLDSCCSLKPLCSGMGEAVPLVPRRPYFPHPLALGCHYPVSKCCSASIAVTGTVRVKYQWAIVQSIYQILTFSCSSIPIGHRPWYDDTQNLHIFGGSEMVPTFKGIIGELMMS